MANVWLLKAKLLRSSSALKHLERKSGRILMWMWICNLNVINETRIKSGIFTRIKSLMAVSYWFWFRSCHHLYTKNFTTHFLKKSDSCAFCNCTVAACASEGGCLWLAVSPVLTQHSLLLDETCGWQEVPPNLVTTSLSIIICAPVQEDISYWLN